MEIFKLFGSIMVEDKAAMNSLQKVDKEGGKLADGFSKLGKIIAGAFSVAAVVAFGKKVIESSANLQAMEAQFNQVFKDDNAQAVAGITKQVDDLGIHADRLTVSWNKFGGQVKGAGMEGEQALSAVDKATRLAADAAAFFDRSLENTSGSLASFMKGNFAAGDAIGVFTNAKQMDVRANETLGKSWADLTEAERQWLLLETVEKTYELNGAMGQAARESGEYENVMGNLKATFERFYAVVGAPVLEKFLIVVGKVTEGVLWLTEKIQSLDWSKFSEGSEFAKKYLEQIINIAQRLGDKFLDIWHNTIKPFVDNFINLLKELYEENKDKIDLIIELFNAFVSFLETYIFPIFVGLFNVVRDNFDKIKATIQSVLDIISGIVKVFIGLLTADWESMKEGLITIWNALWSGIRNIVEGAWKILSGAFDIVWDSIKQWFDDLVEDATGWGGDFVRGLWKGISFLADWIKEKVYGFVEGIGKTIKDFFGIESPSKLMEEYGRYIDEGLAEGITKNAHLPLEALGNVASSMVSNIDSLVKKISNFDNLSSSQRSSRQNQHKKEKDNYYDHYKNEINAISKRQGVDLGVAQEMHRENLTSGTPKYAKGTKYHPGGLAIVGEQGIELVNLPKGSQVFPNKETETILNQRPIELHLHIGNYIGDDYSLKQLERKLKSIRILEDDRLGVNPA